MDVNTIFETPFDADSYIENWLLSIESESERAFARKHLATSLKAMIAHSEASYQSLEDRVYAEVKGKPNRHSVYLTVVDRDKFDITNGAWFPVLPNEEKVLEKRHLALPENLPMTIDQLFCEGSREDITALKQAVNRKFDGTITVGGKQIAAIFRLIPNTAYKDKIEDLYTLFQQNAIPWVTLNCGYLLRYFSLQLVEASGVQEGQE